MKCCLLLFIFDIFPKHNYIIPIVYSVYNILIINTWGLLAHAPTNPNTTVLTNPKLVSLKPDRTEHVSRGCECTKNSL